MKSFAIKLTLCALALAALPVNCLGKRHDLPPDPKFLAIDRIAIIPTVDLRAGKKDNVNLEKLEKTAEGILKRKNYSATQSGSQGVTGEIAEEDLNDAKPEWVRRLGPPDARWVMVLGLNDVHSKLSFGSTGNAEVVGFLFDKQDGSTLWKGTGIGQAGQGGLLGMAMKGAMSEAAIETAVANLLSTIPKLPRKGK
ncbi:MAG: hypothetical protein WBE72_03200 [Terracidiphilus sp.]